MIAIHNRNGESRQSIRRVALAGFIGTTIEWYDFLLYGMAAALVFPKMFFPQFSPLAGSLASFATFGVAFLARPLGAVVFGHFGDRAGRKPVMVTTTFLMGGATFLIGLLPDYRHAGVLAPILLTALRIVQGIAVGGEWGGATLMTVEHAPEESRSFYSSWTAAGAPAGLILSSVVFAAVSSWSSDAFLTWGWRIAFLLSIVLIAVGLYIRVRIVESPVFSTTERLHTRSEMPILEILKSYKAVSLLAAGALQGSITGFYLVASFSVSYLTGELGVTRRVLFVGLLLGAACQVAGILTFAFLADRVGKRVVMLGGCLGAFLLAYPYFLLIDTRRPILIWLGMGSWMFTGGAIAGIAGPYMAELYPARLRYSGISLSYQIAGMVGGAPVPLIATTLLHAAKGSSMLVAAYLAIVSLTSLIFAGFSSRRQQALHSEPRPYQGVGVRVAPMFRRRQRG